MKSKLLLSLSLVASFATVTACGTNRAQESAVFTSDGEACAAYVPAAGVDVGIWLKGITSQAKMKKIFECASVPEVLPQGKGRGTGFLFVAFPAWNALQTKVGSLIWGGKILTTAGDKTTLVNIMVDSGRTRYNANVYKAAGMIDGRPSIILDYRVDQSAAASAPKGLAEPLVDGIIHGIRDEIREVGGSGVYLGRAHLYKGFLTNWSDPSLSDAEFADHGNWVFAANFILDFRP